MTVQICPECKFANKEVATTCAYCGVDFIVPNCYYHPDRKAETKCSKCQKPICFEDGQKTVREDEVKYDDPLLVFLSICCCCLGGAGIWDTTKKYMKKETLFYCADCATNQEANLQGTVVKDR